MRFKSLGKVPESWSEEEVMPPPAIGLELWSKGQRGMSPPAIGPEWSAGRKECPRELLDPMLWSGGKEAIPSPISLEKIDYKNECF